MKNKGIYLDTMMWHEMLDFNKDTVLLVLASEKFDENDYIRNYQVFLEKRNGLSHRIKLIFSRFYWQDFAIRLKNLL